MGCDIHSFAEVKKNGKWDLVGDVFPYNETEQEIYKKTHGSEPFRWRSYGMFGFLADVRNYSNVPTISEARHSIPEDASSVVKDEWEDGMDFYHTATWLTLKQLVEFNYDQVFWDRRITKQLSVNCWTGAGHAEDEETEGRHLTIREFLGPQFFRDLDILKSLGDPDNVRIVFWFDN
jgi:hypothetical protein